MQSASHNILFLTHHRRSKTFARSTSFARCLVERGHQVMIICVSEDKRSGVLEYVEDDVNYVETPDLLWGRMRSGWDPWSITARTSFLRGREFDLVHAFETRPATIYPLKSYLRRRPTPVVIDWNDWWGRGGLISELRPRWYRMLFGSIETYFEEHFRPLANATTVISHALGERATSLGVAPDTVHWIPGGADTDLMQAIPQDTHREKYGVPTDALVLAFAALDVTMDAESIFAATKIALQTCPKIYLIMTGGNSAPLRALAARSGIESRFKHFGQLPLRSTLAEILSCADIFLLPFPDKPSNRGRWPNKIGDYMSLGRPTVTNPVGEMGILFRTERIGMLADETAEDFAAKITALIEDQGLRDDLGRNARRVAEEEFHWKKSAVLLENVYKNAIHQFTRCERR